VTNNAHVNEMIGHSWLNNRLQSVYQDPERKAGEVKGYYENGALRFRYPIKNNNLHGEGRTWYEDGALECQEEYANGLHNGMKRQWYKSGKIKLEKSYNHGFAHGLHKEWHENGNFKQHSTYENGKLEGEHREWYVDGRLEYYGKYSNGLKHGYHKHWDPSGKLISEAVYTKGIRVPRKIHRLIASNKLNAKVILGVRNSAVRRVCLDEFGYERFLSQVEHIVIEKDGDYELVKIDWNKQEEPIHLVKVKCHSTGAYYTLRVPPRMKTVKQAIAWTFHMDKDQYNPIKES
jgi:hypothetical protein